jgi:hypothetical protein
MKQLFFAVSLLFLFTACQKETRCIDGTIQWGGDPASDGLEWYFESPELSRHVKLKDLASEYKVDNLSISVCLVKTDEKYQCFCAEPMDVYAIKSIRKR